MTWATFFPSSAKRNAEVKLLATQLKSAFKEAREAHEQSATIQKMLAQQTNMLDEMANAAGGMIWRKDSAGRYMFANHHLCTEFFGIPSCEDYQEHTDVELITTFMAKNHKQHTFMPNCKIIDDFTMDKGEKCHFVQFGYVGEKAMVLNMINTPIYRRSVFDGTVGFAFDVSNICNTWSHRIIRMLENGTATKLADGAFYITTPDEICEPMFDALARPVEIPERSNT